jgi:predicted PurR-regulated permease PerM
MERRSLEDNAFLLLLALVTVAFFWLLLPFYGAVFWAVILAIVFHPVQRWLTARLKGRRTVAALINLVLCIVIAIIPITIILASLVSEGTALVQRLQGGEMTVPGLEEAFERLPDGARTWLDRFGMTDVDTIRDRLRTAAVTVTQYLAERAVNVGQNTLRFVAGVGIMLYVLFFLFRDGPRIGRNIRDSMPLSQAYSRRLLDVFVSVVRATVKGNIVIAMIQGVIGGLAFWALGIQGALLWGVLMTFLSILPAIGSGLVWAPAAAILFASGDVLRGAILVAVGVFVIGLVDNLLRPPLVGKDTKLPDYVVLVSTVGGLSLFGINGFVIGPLIAALFFACWTVFRIDWAAQSEPRSSTVILPPE